MRGKRYLAGLVVGVLPTAGAMSISIRPAEGMHIVALAGVIEGELRAIRVVCHVTRLSGGCGRCSMSGKNDPAKSTEHVLKPLRLRAEVDDRRAAGVALLLTEGLPAFWEADRIV